MDESWIKVFAVKNKISLESDTTYAYVCILITLYSGVINN